MFSGFRLKTPFHGRLNLLSCLPILTADSGFQISPRHPDTLSDQDKWSLVLRP